jgi:pimeloyl-ACP methyl ester carboxylesterase
MRELPVVFLPGSSGQVESWRPVSDRLAGRAPSILVRYPGLADAAPDPAIQSLADLHDHVMASLPPRFDLVAMSMGCVLALRAVLEQPGRVNRLVLVAASGGIDVVRLGGEDWRPGWRSRHPLAPTWFLEDRTDLTARLGSITTPTLLLFGDADPISPTAVGQFLADSIPSARLEIIAGATHDLELEHPDLLARLIDGHLNAPGTAR